MTKIKPSSVLAPLIALCAILAVAGLSIVAGAPLGSKMTVTAMIPLAIMFAATLTLVTVDVVTVLRGRRHTRTENRNQYAPQQVNAGALAWQGGEAAFAARYCDKCGNPLSLLYQDSMLYH